MVVFVFCVVVFSALIVTFKLGHLKGSKTEKYNISEVIGLIPYAVQFVAGVIVLINHYRG